MAKSIVVTLIDDLEGGTASETVAFSLDGKNYEIDLNDTNAAKLRKALEPFAEKAVTVGRTGGSARPERRSLTAFSQLSDDEKARYRVWAKAPAARRIADSKVEEWKAAGKP